MDGKHQQQEQRDVIPFHTHLEEQCILLSTFMLEVFRRLERFLHVSHA